MFVFPLGWFFRALGGSPIDRSTKENKVSAIAKLFKENDEFRMAMSPEGTRKKVKKWRTGFYYIAKEANVPIIMFTLDFENKQNSIIGQEIRESEDSLRGVFERQEFWGRQVLGDDDIFWEFRITQKSF